MLLAIDVGNSNTSVGLFDRDKQLRFLASLDTDSRKTADQISIDLMNLFALYHFRFEDVTGAILCSVVPPLNFMMEKALSRLLGKPPMVVGPGVRTGLNIRLAVQSQVGADIVADAVAALEKFEPPIVTIDMGTATTMSVRGPELRGRDAAAGGQRVPGGPKPPGGPAARHLPPAPQGVDRQDDGGLYALRHRLRHGGNAGRHYRPHQGDVAG